jgi:hypothetical protein
MKRAEVLQEIYRAALILAGNRGKYSPEDEYEDRIDELILPLVCAVTETNNTIPEEDANMTVPGALRTIQRYDNIIIRSAIRRHEQIPK